MTNRVDDVIHSVQNRGLLVWALHFTLENGAVEIIKHLRTYKLGRFGNITLF